MTSKGHGDGIAAIILAGGFSNRFGSHDKLLAPLNGKPLAAHCAALVAGLPVHMAIAVVPPQNQTISQLFSDAGIEPVINPDAALGQATSMAAGIRHIRDRPVTHALVLLADMPFVTAAHIGELGLQIGDNDAAASRHDGHLQPPILFARRTFSALATLTGDTGGRAFLATLDRLVPVDIAPREAADIDTPDALRRYSGS